MSKLSDYFSYSPLRAGESTRLAKHKNTPFKPVVDPSCYVGIEVEVEQITKGPVPFLTDFWKTVPDGSLRNNGVEYVSYPLRGKLIYIALEELANHLQKNNPKHEFTDRTSVHVHMNVRYLTDEQFLSLVLVYQTLEPIFFHFTKRVPNTNREENNYCVPVNSSKYYLKLPYYIGSYLHTREPKFLHGLINRWRKYTAFNVAPVATQGTVEFRHLGGTCDVNLIHSWINMILHLRKYIKTHTFEEIKETLLQLNTNSSYSQFLEDVLGSTLDLPFTDQQTLLEENVAAAKEILSLVEEVKKPPVELDKFLVSPFVSTLHSICGEPVCVKARQYPEEYVRLVTELREWHTFMINNDYSSAQMRTDPTFKRLKEAVYGFEIKIDPEDLQVAAASQRNKQPDHFNILELS